MPRQYFTIRLTEDQTLLLDLLRGEQSPEQYMRSLLRDAARQAGRDWPATPGRGRPSSEGWDPNHPMYRDIEDVEVILPPRND